MSAQLLRDPTRPGAKQAVDKTKVFVWRGQKKFTNDLKVQFLEEFVRSGLMYEAAEKVGVTGATIMSHAKEDEAFGAAYEEAKQLCIDTTLVKEARRRALEGTDKPLIGGRNKDEIIAYEKIYDSRLHELLLKASRPEEYRENAKAGINITGGVLALSAQPMQSSDWERTIDRSGNIIEGSAIDVTTGQQTAIDITPQAAPIESPQSADPAAATGLKRKKRIRHGG